MTAESMARLHWLQASDAETWFPPAQQALIEPNGLLALGGELTRTRLLAAYRQGLFPWYNEGEVVQWWCPDPRCVLPTRAFHASRSLQRRMRQADYGISIDRCFARVIDACAAPRSQAQGTWINPDMRRAYLDLHRAGYAHSLEVWTQGRLVGGIYGVAIGRMFFGESMFSRQRDASKIALYWLAQQLQAWHMPLIDAQVSSAHLRSLGAVHLPRATFLQQINVLCALPSPAWRISLADMPTASAHLPSPAATGQ